MSEVVNREHIEAHLKTQFSLSDEQIDSLLPSFINTLADYISELEAQFEAGDKEGVGRVAHTTKGVLFNLGLRKQAALAKEIELKAKDGRELIEIEQILEKLKSSLAPLLNNR